MYTLEVLTNEHRQIERVLDALETYSKRLANAEPAPSADFVAFVEWMSDYADEHHHAKEENVLFAALEAHGVSRHTGPLAVMLGEHEQIRLLIQRMEAAASTGGRWTASDRIAVSRMAMDYVALLRAHILREDDLLYPMAESRLQPTISCEMDAEVRVFEARHMADGTTAGLLSRARYLTKAYSRTVQSTFPSRRMPSVPVV